MFANWGDSYFDEPEETQKEEKKNESKKVANTKQELK
jgi:hypothetical protein